MSHTGAGTSSRAVREPRAARVYDDAMPSRKHSNAGSSSLFPEADGLRPLAERMRPRALDEIVGQDRLLGPGTALRRALEAGSVHSMVLWGPPGCGKPT